MIGLSIGLVPDLFFFRLSHLLQEPCPFLIGLSLEVDLLYGFCGESDANGGESVVESERIISKKK